MLRFPKDRLEVHSLLLMAAQQVGNFSTMGFQMVMGWSLSRPEYDILISLLSLIGIVVTPLDSVRTALAHFAARLVQANRRGDVRRLLRGWYGYLAVLSVAVLVLGFLFRGSFMAFFHLDRPALAALTFLVLAVSVYAPVFTGALQGLQSFVWFSVVGHSWGVSRLVFALILVLVVSASAEVGLTAQLLAVFVLSGLGLWSLHGLVGREAPTGGMLSGTRTYAVRSFFILAAFSVLMNADMVLVRHYFPGFSEVYARATTIARAIIFFPQPIVGAMFPKVASEGGTSQANWWTLGRAVLYSIACVAALCLVVALFPQVPLFLLFHERAPDAELIRLVRRVVWAMAPLALVYLFMNFELAQHRFGATIPLVLCAAGFVGGTMFLHRSAWDVVGWLTAMSTLALILIVIGLPWKNLRARNAAPPVT